MGRWSVEKMVELGSRHAELEGRGDLEPLLATVHPEPVYEFHPVHKQMTGFDKVRRYYEQFIVHFLPLRSSVELLGQWASESELVQEYRVALELDSGTESYNVVAILWEKDGLLGGERVYADEQFLRRMLGDLFGELEEIR